MPRRSRSAAVSTETTGGSASIRRTLARPTPVSLATCRTECPACRSTWIWCRLSMSIILFLATDLVRGGTLTGAPRDHRGVARISGKGLDRITGTRSLDLRRQLDALYPCYYFWVRTPPGAPVCPVCGGSMRSRDAPHP